MGITNVVVSDIDIVNLSTYCGVTIYIFVDWLCKWRHTKVINFWSIIDIFKIIANILFITAQVLFCACYTTFLISLNCEININKWFTFYKYHYLICILQRGKVIKQLNLTVILWFFYVCSSTMMKSIHGTNFVERYKMYIFFKRNHLLTIFISTCIYKIGVILVFLYLFVIQK